MGLWSVWTARVTLCLHEKAVPYQLTTKKEDIMNDKAYRILATVLNTLPKGFPLFKPRQKEA